MIPTTMRAAVLTEPGRIELRQVPVPSCGPGDVLVAVRRAGICGTDIHMFNGHFARDSLPIIPGHEFSGVIAATGSAATRHAVGTPVVADINVGCGNCYFCRKNEVLLCSDIKQIGIHRDGGFAEYVLVPEAHIIPIPDDMPMDVAAVVEPLSCIVRSFQRNRVHAGQSVVVLGAGPIGNLHVQMARLVGAAPIVAVDLNANRLKAAAAAGADFTVADPAEVEPLVRRLTDGRGADVVIESVGLPALYEQAFRLVRPGGQVAAFGVAAPEARASYAPLDLVMREMSLKGTVASSGDDFHDALTLLRYGRMKTDEFTRVVRPLGELQAAIESFRSDQNTLKIQIDATA